MELTKKCKHCEIDKPVSEFPKAGGKSLQPYCKPCDKVRKNKWYQENKERVAKIQAERYKEKLRQDPDFHKKYYAANRDKILEKNTKQAKKYKDKINERNRGYRKLEKYKNKSADYAKRRMKGIISADPNYFKKVYKKRKEVLDSTGTREEYNAKQREFKKRHPNRYKNYVLSDLAKQNRKIKSREWGKMKNETDIGFKIAKNYRSRIRLALKNSETKRCDSLFNLLGCSIDYFKSYFCNLFTDGMSWELFMQGEIHIDHIKPCIKFDLTKENEQRKCFHYSNCQPLWKLDNLKKGSKYEEQKAA